ncbi:hypothetical protein RIF29_11809 [Crotalaria pallida]|uniref:GrpE protein homolog n=1 Tax=Crotalaria pallida TaxID=3830 RepID=A0AAN9P162_CROPI
MAAFLSNPSLLGLSSSTHFRTNFLPFPSLSLSSSPRPNLTTPPTNANGLLLLGFPTLSLINPTTTTTLFNSHLASHSPNSIPSTNEETEDTQNEVRANDDDEDKKSLPSLVALIEAYKEAILHGDEKAISSIEVRILSTENKRNELTQKVSTLSAEKVVSKNNYLRLQADFDNFRKRIEKEKLSIQSNAQVEVVEKLLLMVDTFERAKQQTKAATEKEKQIDASYLGIYKQFVETLRSHHVSVVATVGKPFDPLLHEAIGREKSQEFKEGIIIKESRRGFLLRDRVLRPALVKVSLGPGNKKSEVASNKSQEQPSTAVGIDER